MTSYIHQHQPQKAQSFTRLPNFLFEAPTFKPLSCAGQTSPAKAGGRTSTAGFTSTIPSMRWWSCSIAGGKRRSIPCGNCSMPDWLTSRSRAVENPTVSTQNPMKRYQTLTSRNPAAVRRRAENRTHEVRKSILLEYENQTVYRNTEIKKIYLYLIHSIPIRAIFSPDFHVEPPGKERKG